MYNMMFNFIKHLVTEFILFEELKAHLSMYHCADANGKIFHMIKHHFLRVFCVQLPATQ